MNAQTIDKGFNPYRWLANTLASTFHYDLDPTRRLVSPGADDLHTTEHLVLTPDDCRIPGMLFRPKAASGQAVLLGHGTGAELLLPNYRLIETMLARGITVMTFELDGHGDNPRPLGYPSCLACVPCVLAHLRGLEGVDPDRIGYLGISLGGVMGLHAAIEAPWLKAMVLIATPLKIDVSERSRLQEALGLLHPTIMPTLTEASVDHLLGILMNPVRFGEEAAYSLLDRECYESVGAIIAALDPLAKACEAPPIPTRLIQGEWDNVVPLETAYRLLDALPGPADLVTIPRKNHLTLLFHQPTAIAAAEWFEKHL